MKKKSHDRSPDKKGFSVAIPKRLLAEIEKIAKSETRSRNGQIERFLDDCVKRYKGIKPLESVDTNDGMGQQDKAN